MKKISINKIKEVFSKSGNFLQNVISTGKTTIFIVKRTSSGDNGDFCILYDSKTSLDLEGVTKINNIPIDSLSESGRYISFLRSVALLNGIVSFNSERIYLCIDGQVQCFSEFYSLKNEETPIYIDRVVTDEDSFLDENSTSLVTFDSIRYGKMIPCYRWSEFIREKNVNMDEKLAEDHSKIKESIEGQLKTMFDENKSKHEDFLTTMTTIFQKKDTLKEKGNEILYNKLVFWSNILNVLSSS